MTARARNWIGGEWADSAGGRTADAVDPASGEVIGRFADGGAEDAAAAIAAARRALDHGDWSHRPRLREQVLLDMAERVERAAPELAELLTADNGKLLGESRGEIAAAVSELRYYAGLARNVFGRIIELEPGLHASLHREPLGVAAIIVPWNAPLILAVRSLAPALAAGCTAVVKSAPQTAMASERFFRLLGGAEGLPAGAVNLFSETGSAGAKELVASQSVDIVSYTGSSETGKAIMAAAAPTLKRINLELGGSAPCIIHEDADIDATVAQLVRGGLFMAGQYCCSATRLLIHESILDATLARFREAMAGVVLGPGRDPASQMGPVVDEAGRTRVRDLLDRARRGGAVPVLEAEVPGGPLANGWFLTPSLYFDAAPDSPMYTEEVFGPVLVADSFADEGEAVAKANASRFGLAASVWTRDLQRGQRVALRIKAGTVWINSHGRTFAEIENGGYKESGIGALHGHEGLSAFLQTKHVNWSTE
ncbi:MAG: aldehyde dehydrogenase family protein [Sphingomonas sp.]